jgi:prevent-host-death family protein
VKTVNIHEAKTHLSRLLAEVAAGQEITIAKAGKPVARLVPVRASGRESSMGMDRGHARIAPDFDAPLAEDLLAAFEDADPA